MAVLGGTRQLDQDLDLGGMRVFNPRAPVASDDLVRLSDVAALAFSHVTDTSTIYDSHVYNGTIAFDPASLTVTPNAGTSVSIGLAATAVIPGSYTNANITVDSMGRITAASNGGASGITQLTGDVTAGPGSGSQAATIVSGAVTYAKIQNVTNNRVVGNVSGSAHAPMELTASDLSTLLGLATIATTGSATNLTTGTLPSGRFPALAGDVTTTIGSTVTTLASVVTAGSASYANLTVDAKGRVVAFASGTTPLLPANNLSDLASTATARTNLGLGSSATRPASDFLQVANNLSDLASASNARLNLGLVAIATTGSAADLTTGTLPAARLGAFTGDATSAGGTYALTISGLALSKLATIADQRLIGNVSGGTATPSALTSSQVSTFLGLGTAAFQPSSAFEVPLTFSTGLTRATNTITANISTGVSGGQVAVGGTGSGNWLVLSSTSHATKGKIVLGTASLAYFDEATGRLIVGNSGTVPGNASLVCTQQLHATINGNNSLFISNDSTGSSAGAGFIISQDKAAATIGKYFSLSMFGTNWTTSGVLTPGTAFFENTTNGNFVRSTYGSGDHIWTTTSSRTERLRIANNGTVSIAGLSSNGFVKTTGGTGTLTVDTTSYQPALTLAAGAVAFGASTTNTATDANNFYYDGTNHRVIVGKGGSYTPAAGGPLTVSGVYTGDSWGTSIAFDKSSTDQGITKSGGGNLYIATKGSSSSGIGFITNGASRMFLDGSAGTLSTMSVVPSSDVTYSLGASGAAWDAVWAETICRAGVPGVISMASTGPLIDSNTTGSFILSHQSTNGRLLSDATGILFFPVLGGGATGVAKQTITGSRGGNAALASLLAKLDSYGLIADSTTT